jgi:hypothetical protein
MFGGFTDKPRILRGAFVEYGLSIPPLFVVFQFNPESLTRNRSLSYSASAPGSTRDKGSAESLRDFHKRYDDLTQLRDEQFVTVQEEVISFQIRLDTSEKLDQFDPITGLFGIAPQLSTLELMVHPKDESLFGQALGSLLGSPGGFSFTSKPNPPLILFIWGRKRVLPVNINSLNITELFYSPDLDPIRATVDVNLTVIEGKNMPYLGTKAIKETLAALNLANINIIDIANVVIPG